MPRGDGRSIGRAHYRANQLGVGMSAHGYVKAKVGTSHPMADPNGWCYLHKLVAVAALGRPLRADEVVHHRDGDRRNNTWENLEVTTRGAHNAHHNAGRDRGPDGRWLPPDGRTHDDLPTPTPRSPR